MNVCFFGSYSPDYSRNRILIKGLQKNGVKVLHCHSTKGLFLVRYFELIKQYWPQRKNIDVIFVAFIGQLDMPLAWFLALLTKKRVIFDMFYSMYDTYVFDRKSCKPTSIRAKTYFWIDKLAASLADLVITDTNAQADYFKKIFKIQSHKFKRIFVGADDTIFKRRVSKKNKRIIIEFHGMFTRLQGAEVFIKAAKTLENNPNIEFWLIGGSKVYHVPCVLLHKLRPSSLKIFPRQKLKDLSKLVAQADVTVGHLGTSQKARNVISNKTYEGLACANAVIVADTKANKELLIDKENALFVKLDSVGDLVNKILVLSKNRILRENISENGHRLFKKSLTNVKTSMYLIKVIEKELAEV